VDITGFIFFLGPLFIVSPLALAAGILTTSNGPAANLCVRIMYVFWILLTGCLAMSVIYFGIRLIKALSFHLKKFNVTSERLGEVKAGIFKVHLLVI
jgi:hypothetical protein